MGAFLEKEPKEGTFQIYALKEKRMGLYFAGLTPGRQRLAFVLLKKNKSAGPETPPAESRCDG